MDEEIYITNQGSKFQVQTVVEEVYGERGNHPFPGDTNRRKDNRTQPAGIQEHYMEVYDDEGTAWKATSINWDTD